MLIIKFVHILCTFYMLVAHTLISFVSSTNTLTDIGAGNYHESIALGIDVRKQLGLKTPKDKKTSVFAILKGYLKTNWLLGNRSAEELAKLPELKNERYNGTEDIRAYGNILLSSPAYHVRSSCLPLDGYKSNIRY